MEIMTRVQPEGWQLYRLGQLFEERKEKVSDKDFPPLSVTMKGILPQLDTAAKSDDGDNRKLVRRGDYVINSRSDRKGSGGISGYDGSVSLISIVLKPKTINPRFAHHLLRSPAFQEEFYRWGHGIVADLWTTRFSDMKNIRLHIPDRETQKAIADFLDRETARIDQLIEKKTAMASMVDERVANQIAGLVTGRGAAGRDTKHSGLHWCPQIPSEWQVKKGFHIGKIVGTVSGEEVDDQEGAIPYIKVNDLNACDAARLNFTSSFLIPTSRFRGYDKDFLVFPKRGAAIFTNKVAIAPSISTIDPNVMGWQIFADFEIEFVLWLLKTRRLDDLADISTVPQINNKHIYPEKFPIPSLHEQKEIVQKIRKARSESRRIAETVRSSVKLLSELRSALVTAAVTGQIDVTNWGKKGQTDRRLDQIEEAMSA